MTRNRMVRVVVLPLLLAACGGGEAAESDAAGAAPAGTTAEATQAQAPSAADAEYARLTASWTDAAVEGCGRTLQEALGTRELVQGALDGVSDPQGRATAELEDARHWMKLGNDKVAEIQGRLEAGECDGSVTLALDEAVQFYVKAGTSAVQAGQIAGS
jgi:hypothetical protein